MFHIFHFLESDMVVWNCKSLVVNIHWHLHREKIPDFNAFSVKLQ